MKYMIYTHDQKDSLHIRKEQRDNHLNFLNTENPNVKLLTAGPWLDDQDTMRGSLLIVEAGRLSDVESWLEQDPYRLAGLTAKTEIHPFIWAIGGPDN